MTTGMSRLGKDSLLREAMAVLARAPQASMADVAAQAGVGRTTLYRHFGDRETMVAEVGRQGARMFIAAFASARPDSGQGLDAIERICMQLFTVPDVLSLMFADHPIITDEIFAEIERESPVPRPDPGQDPLEPIIIRGQSDGSISGEIPPAWAAAFIFFTIGSGHLYRLTDGGAVDSERSPEALELTIRAVRRALAVY